MGRWGRSQPLRSRLGLAGLADDHDPAHCSPVKVAMSKAKYLHSMLLKGRRLKDFHIAAD